MLLLLPIRPRANCVRTAAENYHKATGGAALTATTTCQDHDAVQLLTYVATSTTADSWSCCARAASAANVATGPPATTAHALKPRAVLLRERNTTRGNETYRERKTADVRGKPWPTAGGWPERVDASLHGQRHLATATSRSDPVGLPLLQDHRATSPKPVEIRPTARTDWTRASAATTASHEAPSKSGILNTLRKSAEGPCAAYAGRVRAK